MQEHKQLRLTFQKAAETKAIEEGQDVVSEGVETEVHRDTGCGWGRRSEDDASEGLTCRVGIQRRVWGGTEEGGRMEDGWVGGDGWRSCEEARMRHVG